MLARFSPRSLPVHTALITALCLSACDKKEPVPTSSAGDAVTSPAKTPPVPPAPQLADFADKLGFAGQLPPDVDLYLGSINAKTHIAAFKQTRFFNELVSALEKNKEPDAPPAPALNLAEALLGDEFFVSASQGSAAFLSWFMEFNRLSSEMNIRKLGKTSASPGDASTLLSQLEPLLQSPQLRQRVEKWLLAFELPPLLAGIRLENPEAGAQALFTPEFLAGIAGGPAELTDTKTQDGTLFHVVSTDGSKLLTDERKQAILEDLPPDFSEEAKASVSRVLDETCKKRLCFGWGVRGNYLLFALGKNLDHVRFAGTPKESLLSRPEMAALLPLKEKNLMLLNYGSEQLLKETVNQHPLLPMLRTAVDELKAQADAEPNMASAGAKAEEFLTKYEKLEEAVFARTFSAQVAALWWEQGLHAELLGGIEAVGYSKGTPLRFARLIDKPTTLFGVAYQHDRSFDSKVNAWGETLLQMLYATASEFVKKGGAGPLVQMQLGMVENTILPHLLSIYTAQKEMTLNGLGTDTGFVMDAEGKTPTLPGVPPETKDKPFLRLTTFSEVVNRAQLGTAWEKISAAIAAGSKQIMAVANPGGSPATGSILPDPINSDKNGVTSYFFGMPFFSGDLLPCASVNDTVLMLSTSKNATEAYAAELAQADPAPTNGFIWTANPGHFVQYAIQTGELFAPNAKPEQKEASRQILKWSKPFQKIRSRCFEENHLTRRSFSWEMADLDPSE